MSSGEPEAWNGSVAINGATGYIGTHVADELVRQGEQTVCLVRSSTSRDARFLASRGTKIIKADAQASDKTRNHEAIDVVCQCRRTASS